MSALCASAAVVAVVTIKQLWRAEAAAILHDFVFCDNRTRKELQLQTSCKSYFPFMTMPRNKDVSFYNQVRSEHNQSNPQTNVLWLCPSTSIFSLHNVDL